MSRILVMPDDETELRYNLYSLGLVDYLHWLPQSAKSFYTTDDLWLICARQCMLQLANTDNLREYVSAIIGRVRSSLTRDKRAPNLRC